MEPDADAVVVGGGVVGLAVAAELAGRFGRILLLERLPRLGEGASTRNSGVVHSGIYYPPGSLKARLCVEGSRLLHAFCAERGVPLRRCGKLVVASEASEVPALERLKAQGMSNGVEGLEILDRGGLKDIEPEAEGVAALRVPSASILDAGELVRALAACAREKGVEILTGVEVSALEPDGKGILVRSSQGDLRVRQAFNCAGLFSDRFQRRRPVHPCRGEYAEVVPARAGLVRGLVYPAPHEGPGLGVHFTRTVAGGLLVGPNARYVSGKEDYESGRLPVEAFLEPARRLVPALQAGDLRPSYAGIRAKLAPEGDAGFRDFVLEAQDEARGLIHLSGIESPGLTACLALAREAVSRYL